MNTQTGEDFQGTERFLILRRIGAGGMGVVYEAQDRQRATRVALKTLSRLDAESLYRLKQEFRALTDVTHPNLVALYELFSSGEQSFITMELVHGVNFLEYVRAGPRDVSPDTTTRVRVEPAEDGRPTVDLQIATTVVGKADPVAVTPTTEPLLLPEQFNRLRHALRQLAQGVCALHAAGKLHRDIKPSNVLVTAEGRVVVVDFGLVAELEDPLVSEGPEHVIAGTFAYMAPEQAAGRPLSAASDWYSVGLILYEALTGRRPFLGSLSDVLRSKQESAARPPHELLPGVPEDLDTLCVQLLQRLPQDRPSEHEILRRLGMVPGSATSLPSPRPAAGQKTPFIGRQQHLAALNDAYLAARSGQAVIVYVHGRSGVGKSLLVQRFLENLVSREDVVVLAGRCYERESVPYKALDSLVDALSRHLWAWRKKEAAALVPRDVTALTRVFPVLRRVEAMAAATPQALDIPDPQELRRRAFSALRTLLQKLAQRKPLVLSIDDLQWGDVDSAALLADLLRPPDPPPLLLLGCYRSEYAATSPCLRALLQTPQTAHAGLDRRDLAVDPLEVAEARSLALELLADDDPATPARAEAIAQESGGNPYFVQELARHFQEGAPIISSPLGGEEIPKGLASATRITLDEVLWERVRRLPEAPRRLLEVVAVSGKPLRQGDACRTAALSANDHTALTVLRIGRLVRSTGPGEHDEIETYHDRIGETVVAHLPPAILQSRHHQLAITLEASGHGDPETLAVHFQGARDHDKAGLYFGVAADQAAAALAFDRAAQLYRLSLDLRPVEGAFGRQLRTKLGDALANAGRGLEAARAYQAAAAGASAADVLELQRRAAIQSLISGHIDEGLAALRTVLDAVGMRLASTPRRALWSLLLHRAQLWLRGRHFRERDPSQISAEQLSHIDICWSVAVGLSIVDTIRAADFQTRNLLLALRAGEPYRIARALAWEAAHLANAGGPARKHTAKLLQAAETLAQRIKHPHALGLVTLTAGIVAYMEGRWQSARELSEQAEATFRDRCTGVAWELDTAHSFSLWSLFFLGEVAEIRRRLPLLLQEATERGDLYLTTNLGTFVGYLPWLAGDEPEGARRRLREVMEHWSQQGFHVQHLTGLMAQMQIDLYSGEAEAAWKRITQQWPILRRSLFLRVQVVRLFMLHLRARSALLQASRLAHPAPLWRAAERDARRIERERMSWARPLVQLVRAGLAAARGDADGAMDLLAAAATGFDAAHMGLFAAAARRRQGELLGGEAGQALVAQADCWMAAQQIQNPARMAAMHAPGFRD